MIWDQTTATKFQLPETLQADFAKLSQHHLVGALDRLIIYAVEQHASDIHIEPQEAELMIRLRIDGLLRLVLILPSRFTPQVLSRLKVLAGLDISEKRLPQDGRFKLQYDQRYISGRISTCPTIFGEKAVIRLLETPDRYLSLQEQGYHPQQLTVMTQLLQAPHGLVIICGPTGSGKSMSQYALLQQLNTEARNIMTIEDPVEMTLAGIIQTQVEEKLGLGFKRILKHLLRQDPDVLMIGEIRDLETAEIAIKAAQTGHLVLSTLHTAFAEQAILRLEQLGLPRYLILEATRLIVSQRLVRKICQSAELSLDGFKGRTGIFEIIDLNSDIRRKLYQQDSLDLHDYVGRLNLQAAGLQKVQAGITTLEEVQRVI